jgi:transcriptional regulator with XRE-family HTH domain
MEDAGQKLKRIREGLGLRVREVEQAAQKIAQRRKNNEYSLAISRLSDIENHGAVPSLYKLYSLCAIYRLDFVEALRWYGLHLAELPVDSAAFGLAKTHALEFTAASTAAQGAEIQVPLLLDPGIALSRTAFLSRHIQRWGTLPLILLRNLDLKNHRYGFVGAEDWFMHPLVPPGSLLLIDESRRKIASSGWTSEFDRPIYFIESRGGFHCAWCAKAGSKLLLLPHPGSPCAPIVYETKAQLNEVDIVGQVVGVATRLEVRQQPPVRSA